MTIEPPDGHCTVRMSVWMTVEHREMLRYLARRQRRTMNSVIRVAIERIYSGERAAEQRLEAAAGQSRGTSTVLGRT